MPHFENLEQYEANNPKSGKREIIPIAPHSLQASDYRPGKGSPAPARKPEKRPEFRKMDFEPVSIEQMEKEFRAAGKIRKRALSKRRGKNLWKKFILWLRSLFITRKKPRGNQRRDSRKDRDSPRQNTQEKQHGQAKKGGHKGNHPNRGKHGRGRSGRQQPNQKQGGPQKQHQGSRTDQQGEQSRDTKDSSQNKPPRRRNRRNRGRGQGPRQQGNQQSGKQ